MTNFVFGVIGIIFATVTILLYAANVTFRAKLSLWQVIAVVVLVGGGGIMAIIDGGTTEAKEAVSLGVKTEISDAQQFMNYKNALVSNIQERVQTENEWKALVSSNFNNQSVDNFSIEKANSLYEKYRRGCEALEPIGNMASTLNDNETRAMTYQAHETAHKICITTAEWLRETNLVLKSAPNTLQESVSVKVRVDSVSERHWPALKNAHDSVQGFTDSIQHAEKMANGQIRLYDYLKPDSNVRVKYIFINNAKQPDGTSQEIDYRVSDADFAYTSVISAGGNDMTSSRRFFIQNEELVSEPVFNPQTNTRRVIRYPLWLGIGDQLGSENAHKLVKKNGSYKLQERTFGPCIRAEKPKSYQIFCKGVGLVEEYRGDIGGLVLSSVEPL